jgi:hypothetical protein
MIVGGKEDIVPFEKALRFLELIDDSWGYFLPHCGPLGDARVPGRLFERNPSLPERLIAALISRARC